MLIAGTQIEPTSIAERYESFTTSIYLNWPYLVDLKFKHPQVCLHYVSQRHPILLWNFPLFSAFGFQLAENLVQIWNSNVTLRFGFQKWIFLIQYTHACYIHLLWKIISGYTYAVMQWMLHKKLGQGWYNHTVPLQCQCLWNLHRTRVFLSAYII